MPGRRGSITGLYTVLVEGDDMNDPIADTARSILDGHIVLSRRLATVGPFPEHRRPRVDIAGGAGHHHAEQRGRRPNCAGSWPRTVTRRDLIEIGAYVKGANPLVDRSVQLREPIDHFLRQDVTETTPTASRGVSWPALLAAGDEGSSE